MTSEAVSCRSCETVPCETLPWLPARTWDHRSVHPNEPAHILLAERQIIPHEERKAEHTVSAVSTALSAAAENIQRKYAARTDDKQPISETYAIVHAPWTHSETARTISTFEAEKTITQEMITTLGERIFKEAEDLDADNLIESRVIRVELNGYPTPSPVGNQSHSPVSSIKTGFPDAR